VNKTKKAGLFGGTFNPPHAGHYLLAKTVKKEFSLDKVIFIPAFIPPHKDPTGITGAQQRLSMTELLVKNDPDLMVSDYEIKKQGVSYSIDTVKHFMSEFPDTEFYFITGSDAFYFVDTWKQYKELLKIIKFIIYVRRDFPKEKVASKIPEASGMLWHDTGLINISSTELRGNIAHGMNEKEHTGKDVWDYINLNHLYSENQK